MYKGFLEGMFTVEVLWILILDSAHIIELENLWPHLAAKKQMKKGMPEKFPIPSAIVVKYI